MADKSTMDAIQKLVDARPRALLDTIDAEVSTQQNFESTQPGLVLGLRFLVESFREQASLVMDSGARGKGAEATALRSTASTLSLLADAVAKVDPSDEPTPGALRLPVEWCGSSEVHGPHDFMRARRENESPMLRDMLSRRCDGHHERDLSGLDALIAERSAAPSQVISVTSGTTVLDPPVTVAAGETVFMGFAAPADQSSESERMRAYLAGETNIMPGDEPPASALPQAARDEFEAILTSGAAPYAGPVTDPEILKAAKVLEAVPVMFAAPTPLGKDFGAEPVIPGRRVTFADLRAPAPVEPVPHTSNSQVTQMNDCGLQARLSRYEPGVIERPQWHLVGGKAVHRVAEEFERMVLAVKNPQFVADRVKVAGGAAGLWRSAFNSEIIEQVMACPQVPQDDWRASGRGGAEGYTWWLTSGVDMVQRYLDLRMAELDRAILMADSGGTPVLELEGVLDVEGTPHKVVIDQAWRFGANDVVIDDLKSGANAPRGGTFQLAQYAWFLRNVLLFDCKIYGRYWDARKGTYSAPVDLLELHPWDEIVWRIKDAQAKKDAGLFGANPGPFCGGCAVKHACPVVSRA
jgi:hypothetical protein